jgi:hypothetical protein
LGVYDHEATKDLERASENSPLQLAQDESSEEDVVEARTPAAPAFSGPSKKTSLCKGPVTTSEMSRTKVQN